MCSTLQLAVLCLVTAAPLRPTASCQAPADPLMYLGARFTGKTWTTPEAFTAMGQYADAISVKYYFAWTPDFDVLATGEKAANKPILISEWYAKGMDTGLTNRTGAGWRVDTQAQRGAFYENFSLALIQSKNVIGWQWFKYQDNDPNDPNAEASNIDSNKGIVDSHYKPYRPLLESMKRINDNSYALADYFDKRKD